MFSVARVVSRCAMMIVMSELSERWLTVADVAAELGLSEPTVRRMAATGRLPAYRFGQRAYSVSERELALFVVKSRVDRVDVAVGVAGGSEELVAKSA